MSLRNSKPYAGFKAINGVMFVIFGAAIVVRIAQTAGPHLVAVPGLVLGGAMVALGVHRIVLMTRRKR
jgi:hypothetical protein